MRNTILLLIITFGLFYCTPPKYIAKRQSEIVHLDLDNSIINYIPVADVDLKNSRILETSYNLIVNKKYSKLERYINGLENSREATSDLYLSKALLFISKKEYETAAQNLQKIKNDDFKLLKQLLSTDLDYELAKINGTMDYKGFLHRYQELMDYYPDDTSLKKILAIRIRFMRYNY